MALTITKKRLGNSDLEITPMGVGAWAMGGVKAGYAFSWGQQDDGDSIEAIQRAVEYGINWVDTAAVYGIGHSEEVVGKALPTIAQNDRPYVFTKCGRVPDEKGTMITDISPGSVRRECEASLRRLGIEVIDLYQIHWPTDNLDEVAAAWTTMAELQREGKVRWIGVSNFTVAQLRRAQSIAPVTSLQPPYNLIRREIEEEILPYCLDQNIGVISYAPMASGLLTGRMTRERIVALPETDWRRNNPEFKEPKLARNMELVDLLQQIGDRHHRSPGEVAIAWVLRHPAVTAAIVGARNGKQVDGIIGAIDFRLSKAEIDELAVFVD